MAQQKRLTLRQKMFLELLKEKGSLTQRRNDAVAYALEQRGLITLSEQGRWILVNEKGG